MILVAKLKMVAAGVAACALTAGTMAVVAQDSSPKQAANETISGMLTKLSGSQVTLIDGHLAQRSIDIAGVKIFVRSKDKGVVEGGIGDLQIDREVYIDLSNGKPVKVTVSIPEIVTSPPAPHSGRGGER